MIFAQGSSQCNEAADLVIQPWLGSNTRFTWTRIEFYTWIHLVFFLSLRVTPIVYIVLTYDIGFSMSALGLPLFVGVVEADLIATISTLPETYLFEL